VSEQLPKIEIIHLDEPDTSGAAISIPGRHEPLLIWPFRGGSLRQAFALDPDTILCVGNDDQQSLAVFKINCSSGEVVHTTTLEANSYRSLIRGNQTLFVMGSFSAGLIAVDIATLTVIGTYNVALMSGLRGRLAHTSDYFRIDSSIKDSDPRVFHSKELEKKYLSVPALRFNPTHCEYAHRTKSLVFLNKNVHLKERAATETKCLVEVDVEAGTLVRLSGQLEDDKIGRIRLLDAERRTLIVEKSIPAIPVSNGTNSIAAEAFGHRLSNVAKHPDVSADGVWRYGAELSVNDYRGGQVNSRAIIVRMARASEWASDANLSNLELDECLRLRATQIANRHDQELQRRKLFRWDAEKNAEQKLTLPLSLISGVMPAYPLAVEPSNNAFWVWFPDNCIRRVAYDGELGPLIRLEPKHQKNEGAPKIDFEPEGWVVLRRSQAGTYRFHIDEVNRSYGSGEELSPSEPWAEPKTHKAAFSAYVHARTVTRIVLAEWNQAECAKALREQKIRVEGGLEKLLVGQLPSARYLKFEYLIAEQTCSEPEFYQHIVDHRFDVALELRELLKRYLEKLGQGGEGKQPWYSNAVPAMGYTMRALALLDANSTDILRAFMAKRDGEHEIYCWGTIVPDLIERHGWRDREMLRFGVFVVLNIRWGGSGGGDANCYGLLAAAENQVSPSEFADMVIAEIKKFEMEQQWNDQDEFWQLQEFCSDLDVNQPFQADLRAKLESYLPSDGSLN
jgi:hypothetical protein